MKDEIREVIDASVNILAVEYLVKTDNREEYIKQIDKLFNRSIAELQCLHISLSLNMHIRNLGEMITQGDYERQKRNLFNFLEEGE